MKTLLVTGGTGQLGQALVPRLTGDWTLRSLSRGPADGYDEVLTGDISNPEDVDKAVRGADAVLHLACRYANDITFEETLDVNYRGTLLLMEAARREKISHVIFASTNHIWGLAPRKAAPVPDTAAPRPDGWYAISKVWGEAVMAYYADAHGMTTTSLRIGSCMEQVTDERQSHMWLGFDDFVRLVRLSLDRTGPGHRAIHAISTCPDPFFDLSGAQAMGYHSEERAVDNFAEPGIDKTPPKPGIFGRALGGGFAEANFAADLGAWEKAHEDR